MKIINIIIIILSTITSLTINAKGKATIDDYGAIRNFENCGKSIYLIFSADSTFEGSNTILNTLDKYAIHASFFLTGNSLRMEEHKTTINRIIKRGDYLGAHSDKHLLYANWDSERTSLVTADSLQIDIHNNYTELAKFGITAEEAPYFLPPFEWYAVEHITAIKELGLIPINFTSGITTANDYTTPEMSNYQSSEKIITELFHFEANNTLDGAIILIHPGTDTSRTDKLYHHLDYIITKLASLGYTFNRL